LRFGKESDFVHRAGYKLTEIGRLYAIVLSPERVKKLVKQFLHAD